MAGMTWLHLSDWHQRGKDFDRDVVRNALVDDIRHREIISADLAQIDFIIFSGDIAFSGQAEEYQAAIKYLFNPVLDATGLDKDRLFIVPGNHDLDRQRFRLLSEEVMHPLDSNEQVKKWLTDDDNRNHLLQPFATYKQFVIEFTGQDQPDYASIRRFVVDGKHVALLGLNSALMCGRKEDKVRRKKVVNDYGWLVVGEPQLYSRLKEIDNAYIRIAVLHHPFSWLTEFDNDDVEYWLRKKCHFILCGHRHRPSVKVEGGIAGDSVIIPAGASYNKRIVSDQRFTNAYNFVHLDFTKTRVVVYLRHWSEQQKNFIPDIDSHEGGLFQFDLPKSLRDSLSSPQAEPSQQNGETTPVPPISNSVYTSKSLSENFLEEARGYIKQAQDAVQNAIEPFEGMGDIRQIHYRHATESLSMTNTCMLRLRELLNTTPHLPTIITVSREHLIIDVNRVFEQSEELILLLEDSRKPRQQIKERFATLVLVLNELDMHLQGKDLT